MGAPRWFRAVPVRMNGSTVKDSELQQLFDITGITWDYSAMQGVDRAEIGRGARLAVTAFAPCIEAFHKP